MKLDTTLAIGDLARVGGLARRAEQMGFAGLFTAEAMQTPFLSHAVAALETERIELGTAVVPTFPRHPVAIAQQARTTDAACGGRFTLGIGLSHKVMIENMFGLSYDKPARHMKEYLEVLAPLGTDEHKPFLELVPALIVVFRHAFGVNADGSHRKYYYTQESVGIASGFLLAALHHAGLATLTHTPSPMRFLNEILGRPKSERPFLLLVVGYPADDAEVPAISRKSLQDFASFVDT